MPATLRSIEGRYLERRTAVAMRQGQKAQLDKQIATARAQKAQLEVQQELFSKTAILLLKVSGNARSLAQAKIERLVTLALSAITGEAYSFKMDLVQHSGNWAVQFSVINPNGLELDPMTGCGGGIVDICSMALRIAILEMYEPRIDGPILLDEDFKFLSKDYMRAAVEFLRTLVTQTGRQILLVTHDPELAAGADRVYEVQPQGTSSTIVDRTSDS